MGKKCGLRMSLGGLLDPKRPSTGGPIVTGGIRGYSDMAEGGIVRGKGGPTDDEVPMQVAGKNVNLSNTEAVLPAKTVQALGGPEAVEELIERTNGKPPVKGGLREDGEYSDGGLFDRMKGALKSGKEALMGKTQPTWRPPENLKPPEKVQAAQSMGPSQPQAAADSNKINPARTRVNVNVDAKYLADQAAKQANQYGNYGNAAIEAGKRYGPQVTKAVGIAKDAAKGVAGGALAAGAEFMRGDQNDFFNDDSVSGWDKARQLGRVTLRNAGGIGLGTVGFGAGGPLGAAAGAVAGYAGGDAVGGGIFGDPVGDYMKNKAGAKPTTATTEGAVKAIPTLTPEQIEAAKTANANVMSGGEGNGQVAPIGLDRKLLPTPPKAGGVLEQKTKFAADNVALAHERNPEIKGLRAAGVTGDVLGDVTVDGKTGPTGIRTIDAANGQKVYAGRDANGQLHVSSTGGLNADQGDAMRDKQFAAAGYGKDGYGNWMTPQRIAEREQLSGLQKGANQTLGDLIVDKMYARRAGKQQERDLKAQELGLRDSMLQYVGKKDALAEQRLLLAEQREGRRMTADERAARAAELKETHGLIDQMFADKDGKPTKDGAEFKQYVSQFDLNNVPGPDGKPLDRIHALTEAKAKYDARKYVVGTAGGAKTYKDVDPIGTREATLNDVFSFNGNGAWLPNQQMVQFNNGAAISPRKVPKDDFDTQRYLGLTGLR